MLESPIRVGVRQDATSSRIYKAFEKTNFREFFRKLTMPDVLTKLFISTVQRTMPDKENCKYNSISNENAYFRPFFRTFRAEGTYSLTPDTGA